ncbi:MAG: hypothetical protein ACM3S1_03435 [Hyphomicrobiales bacterium]
MFLIADGNNMAWAGFHALRKAMGSETPEAKVRAALLGLTQSVLGFAARSGEPPIPGRPEGTVRLGTRPVTRVAVAFDEGRPLRRRSIYPGYQMGRESTPAFADNERFVLEAIDQFIEMARMLPIEIARGTNTEADDLAAVMVLESEDEVRIGSTDRDFLQLVDERVSIYSPVKRIVVSAENFAEQASPRMADGTPVTFPRERYLEYRVASGDASDDLPGIPGVGAVTAARLLAKAPLDAYFDKPSLANDALGRRNVKLEAALRDEATLEIVARNRLLMDLRLAARRYDSLDGYVTRGAWDEAGFRAWAADQRIAALDIDSVVRAMTAVAEAGG